MKFLTVNTAGATTEIAYFDGQRSSFYKNSDGKKASEILLEQIDLLLGEGSLTDLDYIACITGPGSFTGIRIGVNTVKAFCYALSKPAIGISFNKALYSMVKSKCFCVINGWADNCYVAAYDDQGEQLLPPTAMSMDSAVQLKKQSYGDFALVTDSGEGLSDFGTEAIVAEGGNYLIDATIFAIENGQATTQDKVSPYYAMKSQAERDLEK